MTWCSFNAGFPRQSLCFYWRGVTYHHVDHLLHLVKSHSSTQESSLVLRGCFVLPKITSIHCRFCDPHQELPMSHKLFKPSVQCLLPLLWINVLLNDSRCAVNAFLKSGVTRVFLHLLPSLSLRMLYLITLWTLLLKGSDIVTSWISSCVLLKMKSGIAALACGHSN